MIKKFLVPATKNICQVCGGETKEHSLVKINTYDAEHRYRNSNKKFQNNYKILTCGSCFKKIISAINKATE